MLFPIQTSVFCPPPSDQGLAVEQPKELSFFTEFADISHLFGFVHKAYFWTGQDTPAYLEIFPQNPFQTNGFSTAPMLCWSRSNHASSPNSCPIAFRVYWETRPPCLELRIKQCPFWKQIFPCHLLLFLASEWDVFPLFTDFIHRSYRLVTHKRQSAFTIWLNHIVTSPWALSSAGSYLGGSYPDIEDLYRFTGWWFEIFFIFTPIWGNDAIWLMFFEMGWNHQLVQVLHGMSIALFPYIPSLKKPPSVQWTLQASSLQKAKNRSFFCFRFFRWFFRSIFVGFFCFWVPFGLRIRVGMEKRSDKMATDKDELPQHISWSGWWFQIFFYFQPLLGEMIQFD